MAMLGRAPRIWQVRLWAPPERIEELRELLDEEERARADRFLFPWLRIRFIVAHAALRTIASRLVGQPAASLRWTHGPQGKPRLADHALELNMSHSEDWALIAASERDPLGVDLEAIHPARVSPSLVNMVTSPAERAEFSRMARGRWAIPFFRLWVRKESVIKALGTGLSRPLESIRVPLTAEATPEDIELQPAPEPSRQWLVWDVPAPTGYFAALVVAQALGTTPRRPDPVRTLDLDEI